jgi:hypothetical protein
LDVMKSKYLKISKIQKFLELLKKKVKMWFLLTYSSFNYEKQHDVHNFLVKNLEVYGILNCFNRKIW